MWSATGREEERVGFALRCQTDHGGDDADGQERLRGGDGSGGGGAWDGYGSRDERAGRERAHGTRGNEEIVPYVHTYEETGKRSRTGN